MRRWPAAVQKEIEAANAIGVNVLTYATGREPKYKDAAFDVVVDTQPAESQRAWHDRDCQTRAPGGLQRGPGALANLLRAAGSQLQLRIDTRDQLLKITDPKLFRYHMVFMHGRRAFRLTPAERKQLASYRRARWHPAGRRDLCQQAVCRFVPAGNGGHLSRPTTRANPAQSPTADRRVRRLRHHHRQAAGTSAGVGATNRCGAGPPKARSSWKGSNWMATTT